MTTNALPDERHDGEGHLRYLLTAYLFESISAEGRREVETHLAACAECRAELDDLRATLGQVEEALHAEPASYSFEARRLDRILAAAREGRGRRGVTLRWKWPLLIAAAAAVVIGAVPFLSFDIPRSSRPLMVGIKNVSESAPALGAPATGGRFFEAGGEVAQGVSERKVPSLYSVADEALPPAAAPVPGAGTPPAVADNTPALAAPIAALPVKEEAQVASREKGLERAGVPRVARQSSPGPADPASLADGAAAGTQTAEPLAIKARSVAGAYGGAATPDLGNTQKALDALGKSGDARVEGYVVGLAVDPPGTLQASQPAPPDSPVQGHSLAFRGDAGAPVDVDEARRNYASRFYGAPGGVAGARRRDRSESAVRPETPPPPGVVAGLNEVEKEIADAAGSKPQPYDPTLNRDAKEFKDLDAMSAGADGGTTRFGVDGWVYRRGPGERSGEKLLKEQIAAERDGKDDLLAAGKKPPLVGKVELRFRNPVLLPEPPSATVQAPGLKRLEDAVTIDDYSGPLNSRSSLDQSGVYFQPGFDWTRHGDKNAPAAGPAALETLLRSYFHYRALDPQLDFGAYVKRPVEVPAPTVGDEGLGEEGFRSRWGVNPFVDTRRDHLSTFGMDVDTASYRLARAMLENGALPDPATVRVEEFVNYFREDVPADPKSIFTVACEGGPSLFGEGLDLVKVSVKARELRAEERKAAVLTFAVDTSGSMHVNDRLGLVREALKVLLGSLTADDRVGIVGFGAHAYLVLPHTPARERERIAGAIDSLASMGGTNVEAGLDLAYRAADEVFEKRAVNRVILCSDGVANVGARGPDEVLRKVEAFARRGVYLTSIGFGMGKYNDRMLETLADKGNGNYAYVGSLAEAADVFQKSLPSTLQVLAQDAKIQVDWSPDAVAHYRLLGYENRDIADRDFRNDKVDAGEVGPGSTVTALYEVRRNRSAGGDLGRVFIRYRDAGTGRVEESSHPLSSGVMAASARETSDRFRFIAAAAETAELLRGSYWARNGSHARVLAVLHGLSPDFRALPAWADLEDLVKRAQALTVTALSNLQVSPR